MKKLDLFRSFSSRNFRLFFFGQGLSLVGMWMHQVAMGWLVYELTGSSFALGMVLFFGQIPSLVLSPFVGAMIDRWDRARVFAVCQKLEMLEASVLAALALTGVIEVWHIMALSLFVGVVVAFDMASRQALTVRFVDRKQDLSNAIALTAAMFNGSRLIGPALGGLVLAATSAGVCFLINALSFIAVIWAIAKMDLPPDTAPRSKESVLKDIKGGLLYVWRETALRNILLLLSLGSVTSSAHAVLMPVLATQALGGGARELGWLGGAVGVGASAAALFLASRRTVKGVEMWIGGGACILGVMLALVGQSQNLALTLVLFALFGFGMVAHFASGNTIIQSVVQEDKRGRVMALYTMALIGMTPLGSLLFGYLNDHYGHALTLAVSGFTALVAGIAFLLWLPRLRGRLRQTIEGYDIVP